LALEEEGEKIRRSRIATRLLLSTTRLARITKLSGGLKELNKDTPRQPIASSWESVSSPSPFVSMFMKYKQPKKGERSSVALGKAECTVDCSAKEALAWWFDYCSRERQRSSDEDGNPG